MKNLRMVILFFAFNTFITTLLMSGITQSESHLDPIKSKNAEDNVNELFDEDGSSLLDCTIIDGLCLDPCDVLAYESIRNLHAHLDDDHSGDVDLSESVEFLRDELNYTKGLERRQEAFHPNNDMHISVKELWNMWLSSEVYNWTVEDTVRWLCTHVELGQYAEIFYENAINGSILPRLATNSDHFLSRILGIKSATHRSKITIKAMDVVLFGAPKDTGSYLKDITIACLFILLLAGVARFYHVQQNFEKQRLNMLNEMNLLHEEEQRFQQELLKLKETSHPKMNIEEDNSLHESEDSPYFEDNISILPEREWDSSSGNQTFGDHFDLDDSSKNLLQLWLQLTYERERFAFETKCRKMEEQLQTAKEMCDKLNSTKKQLFGAFVVVHGKIEPKYQAITRARESFNEITMMHKEREQRWESIESLLGFEIIENPGLSHLEFLLQPDLHQLPTPTTAGMAGSAEPGQMSSSNSIRSYKCPTSEGKGKKRRVVKPLALSDNAHDNMSLNSSISSRGQNSSMLRHALKHSRTMPEDLGDFTLDREVSAEGGSSNEKRSSQMNLCLSDSNPCKFLVGNSEIQVANGGSATTPDSAITITSLPPISSSRIPSEEASSRIGSDKKAEKSSSEPSLTKKASSSFPQNENHSSNILRHSKRSSNPIYRSAKDKFYKIKSKIEKKQAEGVRTRNQ